MKLRQFLNVVPKPVKTGAAILLGCAVLAGLAAGLTNYASLPAPVLLAGPGVGLLVGSVTAIWLLCLGYVYADARRRAMPRILWTLIAAFMPNLLGFLLYFCLRRPIALPCTQCGQAIAAEQRFCSWCGYQGSSAIPTGA
jgi:Phospholipase_D-nuclease N-terminal